MRHTIPSHVLNSDLNFCIEEYVRIEEHRQILKDKWFGYLTIEEIAMNHHLSETTVKKILYTIGDEIILKASKMSEKN